MANCLVLWPASALRALAQPKLKKPPAKPKEKTWAAQQVVEVSPQSSSREGTLTQDKPSLVFYNSESEREDDPMASGTIIPLMTWVEILVPSSGVREGPNGLAGLRVHLVPN